MSRFDGEIFWPASVVAFAIVAPAPSATAATYLSVEAAQRALFPSADAFVALPLAPTPAQREAIAAIAGAQARHGELRAWTVRREGAVIGHVFVDNVIGREDFITYAVGIDASGALTPVEILEYRESHGGEIRNRRWLAQFAGRAQPEELAFRTDIKNIAGATLSSEHVTNGVRWLLVLWQQVVRPVEGR
jgi:Na+-translocating ferredoxin:NAD+ oxidoreductase RnfG subunit